MFRSLLWTMSTKYTIMYICEKEKLHSTDKEIINVVIFKRNLSMITIETINCSKLF